MSKRLFTEPGQLDIVEMFTGRPSKRRAGENRRLCGRCNDVELHVFLDAVLNGKYVPTTHGGITVYKLGHPSDWSTSCLLCRLFSYAAEWKQHRIFDEFVLRLVTRRLSNGPFRDRPTASIPELDIPFLAVTTDPNQDMCASGDLSHEFECFGHISWNSCSTSAPPTGRGRFIDPLLADFELVRNWLTFCCKNHTRDCTVESGDPIRMFQLIDCNSNKIVTAIRRMKYIALSYVWGVHSSEDALEDGKLVWKHLPQTIRDAIKITKLLGYRYLWVDRYCIPADPRLKHTQIRKMDIIYQHAQATLLGAAGKNATYGLPGAGTRCRKTQRAVEMGQHKLFSTFARPETVIKQSTWMTRGWTYQEAMLSKRRIFFTDEQVYFECAGMQCSEVIPPDLEQWHTEDRQRFRDALSRPMFELSTLNLALHDVWGYIAAYSQRNLSYDNDSLNGFLGILAFLETSTTALRNFWGIPITTQSDYIARRREWHTTHCFLSSLTWTHKMKKKSQRRPGFPSWSWTGWEGEVEFRHGYVGCECDEAVSPTIIGAETEDKKLVDWESLQLKLNAQTQHDMLPRIIVIEAWTISLRVKYVPFPTPTVLEGRNSVYIPVLDPAILPTERILELGYHVYAEIGQYQDEKITMEDCTAYAKFHLNNRDHDLLERLEFTKFTGVLLRCPNKRQETVILVLGQRCDGIYERIGTVDMGKGTTKIHGKLVQGRLSYPFKIGNRYYFRPLDTVIEDWKLEKTWERLRIG